MGSELETPGRQFWMVIALAHLMSAAKTGAEMFPGHLPVLASARLGRACTEPPGEWRNAVFLSSTTQALEASAVSLLSPWHHDRHREDDWSLQA